MMEYWLMVKGWKWLPYAGAAVLLLLVIWQFSEARYDAGYNASQAIVQAAERAVMLRHIQEAQEVAKIDLEAVIVTANKKESIRYANHNIIETVDTCDAADWLREFNERVRAAETDSYTSRDDSQLGPSTVRSYRF